jgi:hypothetical protein
MNFIKKVLNMIAPGKLPQVGAEMLQKQADAYERDIDNLIKRALTTGHHRLEFELLKKYKRAGYKFDTKGTSVVMHLGVEVYDDIVAFKDKPKTLANHNPENVAGFEET